MKWRVRPGAVGGAASVPGDKSLAHRALILGALSGGTCVIRDLPGGADVMATLDCVRTLGVDIQTIGDSIEIRGGLSVPDADLDARNSGTTMRLLAGVLAGQPFSSKLVGDASLSRRPMARVVEPLTRMGARIHSDSGRAPLAIEGRPLQSITYTLPVASAQVKSAILLAGLFADGETRVIEPIPSRDHTERMLRSVGVPVERENHSIAVRRGRPGPFSIRLPGDVSSAAFLAAAAVLTGSGIEIANVGVNPTRLGFVRALESMGVAVDVMALREELGEPVGTLRISGRAGKPIRVNEDDVPALVDEIPLLAVLATQARGVSEIRGAQELRVKETDRLSGVAEMLTKMGATVELRDDGFIIRGPAELHGATIDSHGDHRLAMAAAVAGVVARGETIVTGAEAAVVSYPNFVETLTDLGGHVDVS